MRIITITKGMVFALLGMGLMLQGCAAGLLAAGAAVGAGAVAYSEGNLETTYAASFDRTWNASLAALREMNITPTDLDRQGNSGTIEAERGSAKDVTVRLERVGPNATKASIRVGIFGDEQLSRAINRQILARLS